ncbi:MAG: hypothetical protein AAB131_12745 [Actinomycetota bacterium]
MNDDLHPSDTPSDELLAVNALIDGTATAADQAVVDASPELQHLLHELQINRAALRQVEVPSDARERAVAAALAAFAAPLDPAGNDPLAAAAASSATSTVVQFERRRRQHRLLGAAAAVAVLLVGAAAFANLGGSDDQATSAGTASAPKIEGATDSSEGQVAATRMADPALSDPAAAVEMEAPAATGAPAASETPATIDSIGAPADQIAEQLDSELELLAYAADREPLPGAPEGGISCAGTDAAVLGEVVYVGRSAVVVRDPASGVVTAFDSATCEVIASVVP